MLPVHPIASIFPAMDDAAFAALRADIAAVGQLEPVWTYEDADGVVYLLDGRHRARAVAELGLTLQTRKFTGDDPAGFVVSLNLHRRHLNEAQRAIVATRLAKLPAHRPADKCTDKGTSDPEPITQTQAAKLLHVGRGSVQIAKALVRDGVPELVQAVETGGVSLAAARTVSMLPVEEQAAVVACGPEAIRERASTVREPPASRRVEEIRHMAEKGYRPEQVANHIGATAGRVRELARVHNITFTTQRIGRKLDHARVIETTVASVDAIAASLSVVPVSLSCLSAARAAELAADLGQSLAVLRRFHNQLKGAANHENVA